MPKENKRKGRFFYLYKPFYLLCLQVKNTPNFFSTVSIIFLLFFSILLYASLFPWIEAVICTAIFSLTVISLFQQHLFVIEPEYELMLAPLTALAFYSIVQGLFTLSIQTHILPALDIFPYSFDLTASFWSGIKILALTSFIRLILFNFRTNIKFLVWGLIVIGNFFALLGIFRFVYESNFSKTLFYFILPQLLPQVGFGTYINQNHFALLMLMTIGLNTSLFCYAGFARNKRILLILFSLISWIALVLTASRGGIISSFAEIAVLIFFPLKNGLKRHTETPQKTKLSGIFTFRRKLATFALTFIILVLGIFLIGQDRVINRFENLPHQIEGNHDSISYRRIEVYQATSQMIRENLFYGVGFGGFRFAISRYINISGEIAPEQAHNDYLEFVASGGIVAIVLAAWFFIRFVLLLQKRFNEFSTSFSSAARLGAICGMTGVALHSMMDFGLQILANLLFFGALLTISIYKSDMETKKVAPAIC